MTDADTSQTDIERFTVASAPDAARVAAVMRLLPEVLLSEDRRVRSVYDAWSRRMLEGERAALASPEQTRELILAHLFLDSVELNALVRDLGLARYRWLPQMLRWEFQLEIERLSGHKVALEISLPDGLTWAERGRGPKRGEVHQEDLEQYVAWFYLARVRTPPVTIRKLEANYIRSRALRGVNITRGRAQVKNGIRRAEQLLDRVSPPALEASHLI